MDMYTCELCGIEFDEFEMNYKAAQQDKKCWCRHCRKTFNKIPRLKRLMLHQVKYERVCSDCNRPYSHWRWSPLWCPECDTRRIKRIDKSLEDALARLTNK